MFYEFGKMKIYKNCFVLEVFVNGIVLFMGFYGNRRMNNLNLIIRFEGFFGCENFYCVVLIFY